MITSSYRNGPGARPILGGVSLLCLVFILCDSSLAQTKHPAPLPVDDSEAASEAEMKPYTELVEHTVGKIPMVPIPGGTFVMGSPDEEELRNDDEGPQHKVQVEPFWMGKFEITWEAYDGWASDMDILRRKALREKETPRDALSLKYQLSQPTKPYVDMSFGMGKKNRPAICMTQLAARTFCQWLTAKTGRYYRLPTEAEWEYACRAGTKTAYHFGDDPSELNDYAWSFENSNDMYQEVGQLKPNPWGLYDMHGNVAEWVLDMHKPEFYSKNAEGISKNPLAIPTEIYPRVVRGGSWYDDPEVLRSAARVGSTEDWKIQDPQLPKSIWYHTDATHVGFRIVRPLVQPTDEEKAAKWDKSEPVQERIEKVE